jgi:hypothetical protein
MSIVFIFDGMFNESPNISPELTWIYVCKISYFYLVWFSVLLGLVLFLAVLYLYFSGLVGLRDGGNLRGDEAESKFFLEAKISLALS